jgi:predicted RNase H-like nuclease
MACFWRFTDLGGEVGRRLAAASQGPIPDALTATSVTGADSFLVVGPLRQGVMDVLGIDTGWRAADTQARALLGLRRSSVFLTAPRTVWDEVDYAAASAACLSTAGKKLSRQVWALAPKLREARTCWARDPGRIHEVHPEVSFQAIAGGTPLAHSKKSWRGQAVRRNLLAATGIRLRDELGEADSVPTDDVLDAAAAAWSAHRIATGAATCLPAMAERDPDGRPVAIWY